MRFEWDDEKNEINKRKHGISFETAVHVFNDPNRYQFVERIVDGEERWQTIGIAEKGGTPMLLTVVHLYGEDGIHLAVRIISARRATPAERRLYAETNF